MSGLLLKKDADARDVATRLAMNKDRILKTWTEKVRKKLPETRDHSTSALEDSLPELLDQFVELLTTADPTKSKRQASAVTVKHGVERAKFEKHSLSALIEEFSVLRKTIFEVLEEDGELPIREREILLEAFRRGIGDSVTAYTDYQQGQILNYVNELEEERARRELFVMALTHDLKNPLTSLSMNIEVIKRHPSPEIVAKIAPKLAETVNRMDGMVTDLLDANHIHAGERLDLKMSSCDLNALVAQTVSDMKAIHGDHFAIHGKISDPGYWNADGLRRALTNLLVNAVKYGDKNIPVSIVLSEREKDVELTVNNKGPVLTSQEIIQIFKPFRRLPAGESREKKGWGLGLTIVRGIAEAHGGRVVTESTLEAGTTFELVFPKDARVAV